MSVLRNLILHPETLRFFLFTLSFVLLAVAFVVRLMRKEYAPLPQQPVRSRPAPAVETSSVPSALQSPTTFSEAAAASEATPVVPTLASIEVTPEPPPQQPVVLQEAAVLPPPPPEPEMRPHLQSVQETLPAPIPEPQIVPVPPPEAQILPVPTEARERFSFEVLQSQPSLAADLLRGALSIVALAVLVALTIVVLPQGAFDRSADSIRIRKSPLPPQDTIALLYLGEETKGNEFHIRGVVRNITTKPVEQLDANVRFYAPDRTLLESAIVRMDIDLIPPDATASFNLSYPDYHGQFGSYSVDFKLRKGDQIPYRDMRGLRVPE